MTCGNPIEDEIKNVFENLFYMVKAEKKLTDDQMECMQFGICDYAPKQVGEVPFFHY